MGCALIIVSVALLVLIWKVLPLITESHGKRLDSLITAFKEAVGGFNTRMDKHEETDTKRHGEVMAEFGELKQDIGEIKGRLPESKAKKESGS